MKFLLTILGLLFITNTVIAVDKSGNYAVWGIGMKSCFSFSTALKVAQIFNSSWFD